MLREILYKKFFYPDLHVACVFDLDYDKIYKSGIHGLIFDIDNTIVAHDKLEISDMIHDLFKNLIAKGFIICFLSNNKKKRVSYFGEILKIQAFHRALKPSPFGMLRAVKSLGLPKNKLAIIGDQIFTDVLCGRVQKIYTVLVDPIGEKKGLINKLKRNLERMILNHKK